MLKNIAAILPAKRNVRYLPQGRSEQAIFKPASGEM
jgi:hypothetical protein